MVFVFCASVIVKPTVCFFLDTNEAYPVHSAEVDGLSKVKALVEAAVVRSGKRDDEFSSTLVCSVDLERERRSKKNPEGILSAVSFILTGTP